MTRTVAVTPAGYVVRIDDRPDHTADRLTDGDRAAVVDRMAAIAADWRAERARAGAVGAFTVEAWEALRRVGAHAIGCTADGLRGVEERWIADAAAAELDLEVPAGWETVNR